MLSRTTVVGLVLLLGHAIGISQPVAPYCVGSRVSDDSYFIGWFYEGVNQRSYLNEQGETNQHFLVYEENWDNRALAQYDSVTAEFPIESISVFIWGVDIFPDYPGGPTSPFTLAIFSQVPSDQGPDPLWGEDTVAAVGVPPAGAWYEFPVRQRLLTGTQLFLQFRWLADTPTAPLLAVDYQSGGKSNSRYGYRQDEELIWKFYYGHDFLLRLNYNIPDTIEGFDNPVNQPDSFAIFIDSDSAEAVGKEEVYLSLKDSLHLAVPLLTASGKFLVVAAWQDDSIGFRSVPIYLEDPAVLPFPLQIQPESLLVYSETSVRVDCQIDITNLYHKSLLCMFSCQQDSVDWLVVDSDCTWVEAFGEDQLTFTIDNQGLDAGDYNADLIIACSTDSNSFMPRSYHVLNQVEVTTDVPWFSDSTFRRSLLLQNYPNPFNQRTIIHSTSAEPVRIYNILGKLVAVINSVVQGRGSHFVFEWDGVDAGGRYVAGGVYFYCQGRSHPVRKMLLLR